MQSRMLSLAIYNVKSWPTLSHLASALMNNMLEFLISTLNSMVTIKFTKFQEMSGLPNRETNALSNSCTDQPRGTGS
jgi:hypothetical protein